MVCVCLAHNRCLSWAAIAVVFTMHYTEAWSVTKMQSMCMAVQRAAWDTIRVVLCNDHP